MGAPDRMPAGRVNIEAVAAAALDAIDRLLPEWLPDGKREADEWSATNPTRNDKSRGSFKVNMRSGAWSDFALDDSGGDLVSLWRYINFMPSQVEAAIDLGTRLNVPLDAPTPPRASKTAKSPWVPMLPVPSDAPAMHQAHSHRGRPQRVAIYRDQSGNLLGAVMRFVTSDGGKDDIPHTFCKNSETGATEWRWMGFPEPRPLYGLEDLTAKPDAAVLIVEGEKCKDVAASALHDFVVISWPGGSKAVHKADWSPLAGRRVVLWPDADSQHTKLTKAEAEAGIDPVSKPLLPAADQPGQKAADSIADLLQALDCAVSMIPLPQPGTLANGWDIADAIQQDGWGDAQLRDFVASARPFPLSDIEAVLPSELESLFGSDSGNGGNLPPAQAESSMQAPDESWRMLLKRSEEGVPKAIMANAYLILTHHPDWRGVLAYDEFSCNVVKLRTPPYSGGVTGLWTSADASKTLIWLQMKEGIMLRASAAADEAALTVARDHPYHAVRDWLERLPPWDGTSRLAMLLEDAFGVDRTPYSEHVGTGWLVAAVARVFNPGCKVDEMLVLEGGQGWGKSTCIRELFGADWYTEMSERPDSKDFMIVMQGSWGVEIGEMQAFSKAEINQVKLIITRRNDKFRPPYERHASDHPRQCVFVGTTNGDQYLVDPTGGRRFLPVACREANVEYIQATRNQLWAEALVRYRDGFQWWSYPQDEARAEQEARFVTDSWEELIKAYLDGKASANAYPQERNGAIEQITTSELLTHALKLDNARHGRPEQTRVGSIMTRLGWVRVRLAADSSGYRLRVFVKP